MRLNHGLMTVTDICAAALSEATGAIEAAHDTAAFLSALENNHRLWRALCEIGRREDWPLPSCRDIEFIIRRSSKLGFGVSDADLAALVTINRRFSEELVDGDDIARIHTKVRLAYREGGEGGGFFPWLLMRMFRPAAPASRHVRTASRDTGCGPAFEPIPA